jgi:Flp pilus assembly protein TadG
MRWAAESHQLFVRRRSEAQSTVEVALSLPVVMLVFVMLLQGALYMHALNVVRSAAQEGARAAAAEGATLADGEARTRTMLAAGLGRRSDSLAVGVDEDAEGVRLAVSGSMSLLLSGPTSKTLLALPLEGRGHVTREMFRPS